MMCRSIFTKGVIAAVLVVLGFALGGMRSAARRTGVGMSDHDREEVASRPSEHVTRLSLESGETLARLLERSTLGPEEARRLTNVVATYRNPRRLRPGFGMDLYWSAEDSTLRRVVIPLGADTILHIAVSDTTAWNVEVELRPVRREVVFLQGKIQSSLYDAIVKAGEGIRIPEAERRALVDILAEQIFAWQIDFSRDLRAGDEFRVIYERQARPDGSARSSRVLAAQFRLSGKNYEAFWLERAQGTSSYYDRNGESLKGMLLRAPLEFRRISSGFGNRYHPILKTNRPHNGIDYAAARGTPVRAVGDGTVVFAGRKGGFGNLVEIRHARGYLTRYAHLQGFAKGIRPGVRVRQGETIGYVGSTGLATGPHLHYELLQNGRPINPASVRLITGDPVPKKDRETYRRAIAPWIAMLDHTSIARMEEDDAAGTKAIVVNVD